MLKQLSFFKKRPDIDIEEFREHWRTRHAEIVRGLPGLLRYTQNHAIAPVLGEGEAPFDGIAEVWFADIDAMRANAGSEALARIREDEANFIDAESMGTLITEEAVIIDGTPGADALKLTGLIKRMPDLAIEQFRETWRNELGPMVREVPGLDRYVQSHVRAGIYRSGREPQFDGMGTLWFAGEDGRAAAGTSAAMQQANALEATFIDFSRSALLWVEEVPIVA